MEFSISINITYNTTNVAATQPLAQLKMLYFAKLKEIFQFLKIKLG